MPNSAASDAKRLFLLDGMALVYRAHFALIRSPRFTSRGVCTSAVFGIANTLLDLQKSWQPTHIALAWDTDQPTERHQTYPEYKAQRDAMPEDIDSQLPLVQRLLEAFRVPTLEIAGFEADDIIGTLASRAAEQGYQVWMVTPDKDYDQLVRENVFVLKPGRQGSQFEVLDVPAVLEKWQIERVDQVIDILGLMGDTSDNVPGIPGIGEKTAQKLIAQFGSVESLLENADKLKGAQRKKVEENRELALLSKQLVTIHTNVPLDVSLETLRAQPCDEARVRELFMELEFQTLGQRIFGAEFSTDHTRTQAIREQREQKVQTGLFTEPSEEKRLADVEHQYRLVRTPAERQQVLQALQGKSAICFDTETTGLDPRSDNPLGISFAVREGEAFFVQLPEDHAAAREILLEFREILENPQVEKIGHNLKFDMTLLKWLGCDVRGPVFDTMLAHAIKDPEESHSLDYLSKLYLAYQPIPITDLIGPKEGPQRNMRDVPLQQLSEYACEDADVTWRVAARLRPEIEAAGFARVCHEVECPLVPVLVDMEYEGIRLDVPAIQAYSKVLAREIDELREAIFAEAGHPFNIDSPKQLGVVLYDEMKLVERPKKTATGQHSTREAELLRLAGKHKIVRDVLEYRNAVKLKSVYIDQLPNYVNRRTGRLHTTYSQLWTATGRMQSNDPNLQTIPVRKERGREIRAAFVPRNEEYLILSADYSQIELRIMAELSGDEAMLQAFRSGLDIHAATASKVFKVPLDRVTREMRDKSKAVNFGIIYGISSFGLQQRLDIPRQEAAELIENYFAQYPGVREYIDRTVQFARDQGYVQTVTGRRRTIRDINSRNHTLRSAAERLAMNSPLQGTAADLLKLAMIQVHRALRQGNFQTKMLLTVHDEIVFDLHRAEQESVIPVIVQAMQTALPMRVPIVVETGVGENWLAAH